MHNESADSRESHRAVRTDGGSPSEGDDPASEDGPVDDRPNDGADSPDDDGHPEGETVTIEEILRANDVLEPTADGTDLQLTTEFATAWRHRIEQIRGGDRMKRWLAAANDVDSGAVAFDESGEHFAVTVDGSPYGEWHSRAAFVADVVAEPTLKEWVPADRLAELPDKHRQELSTRLRMFLETCPSCGGPLAFTESASPTGESVDVSLDCTECGVVIAHGSFEA